MMTFRKVEHQSSINKD